MYRILFKRTDLELNKIVLECEKSHDGIEAYLFLTKHCDPYTFNTAGTLMEAITELGAKKASSVDEFLSRRVVEHHAGYEEEASRLQRAG